MLNQRLNEESEDQVYPSATAVIDPATPDQSVEDFLEDYLDDIMAPVIGKIPRSKRIEIRESIRRHIEHYAALQRERGSTESEAIRHVIAQCSAPKLWSLVLPELHAAVRARSATLRASPKLLDRLTGSANWATITAILTFGIPYVIYLVQAESRLNLPDPEPDVFTIRIWLFAAPLIAGALTGFVSRKKAVRGVVNTVAAITIQALVVAGIEVALKVTRIGPDFETFAGYNLVSVLTGFIPWLLLGSISAALAGLLRNAGTRYAKIIRRTIKARKTQEPVHQPGM